MNTALHPQPWFATWFNSRYYHQLYQHRDHREAEKFIQVLLDELQPPKDSVMLDLGCGTGRHSRYLASRGYTVFGLDLASSSIKEAKKFATDSLYFLNWDMLKPFGKNNFDFVFSFFTSFGYFNSRRENDRVIKNMARAVKTDGIVLIDYLNVCHAENHLIPVEEKEIDGVLYHINRWADDQFIYKRIAIHTGLQMAPMAYTEQVAKFSLEDFDQFFTQNGLEMMATYGDYELNEYDPRSSKRLIVKARKIPI